MNQSAPATETLRTTAAIDVDDLIEDHIQTAVAALDGSAPLLAEMVKDHLGLVSPSRPISANGAVDRGKRIRPRVAMLTCAAAGGEPARVAPLAAAIELLHNFTLIHDDIQDSSPTRRHRPTVWSRWGANQAINAGDALFAAAHLPLFDLGKFGTRPELIVQIARAFERATIEIVSGQVLDLEFEGRADVTPAAYLRMIDGKTAAIVWFAAWAGATLAEAGGATADAYGEFGRALGIGFQIRDDVLGIWGDTAATGKAAADDLRRRKQSLPVLLLRQRADAVAQEELRRLYAATEIDAAGVSRVLELLATYDVRTTIEAEITTYHDRARAALLATGGEPSTARAALLTLVETLADRSG